MTDATSSGVPGRPTGVCRPATSSSGSDDADSIHPGATEFTVTPARPFSIAIVRIRPSMAPFAAAYAADGTRLNSSHDQISYAVFCLKKKKKASSRDHLSRSVAGHLECRLGTL